MTVFSSNYYCVFHNGNPNTYNLVDTKVFKDKGEDEDDHAKSKPFSSDQSSKSMKDENNLKSDKKDYKKEFDQEQYYQQIYRAPNTPDTNPKFDPDLAEFTRDIHGDGNSFQGEDSVFGSQKPKREEQGSYSEEFLRKEANL